ncbi:MULTISPECIES: twin-arginine translocation signal domain-containing protein [Mycobacterium]|uniref:twin-arginine translocation signal domain-containing protein n=1 Tax=Mycobacterium TaxID=1763 RepID=UPI001EE2B33A|nr:MULTISPECIES: twin-arginine translocation signal domain-containing protein [Mycobacterium]
MSRAVPVISRRGVLAGGAALAALGVITACGESAPKPPVVEELLGPLEQARHDSALASAAAGAVGSPPQIAAALSVVATQRAAHARALSTEIARAAGKLVSSTSETSSSSSSASPAGEPEAPPPPPPAVSDVIDSLRKSAEDANRLVASSSGYRAGLLGSIAASCTASATVALVPGGPSI